MNNKTSNQVEEGVEQGLTLEQAFAQLEECIVELEKEELTLAEAFQEYNRGMQLLQHCNETIDHVEAKILQFNRNGGLDEF
jgi:exodeoxyribonuclease VII small subunit